MTTALVLLGIVLTLAFAGWRAWRRMRFFLHVFQLETYKLDRYMRWLRTSGGPVAAGWSHALGALALLLAGGSYLNGWPWGAAGGLIAVWPLLFISSRRYRRDAEKKPLRFTARMTRLSVASGLWAALPVVVGILWGDTWGQAEAVIGGVIGLFIADIGGPLWVALGALCTKPIEQTIQNGFKRQARAHLREHAHLEVIGITGSYGKTSTKHIVAELLSQSYSVLATPGSYNTPMGICLVVNEKLRPEHQVLVLEMGMRYPGDIAELCAIAAPDTSVITSVGIAHLETMGTVDAIAEEKSSILQHMKEGGAAILNIDDPRVAAMADDAPGPVWRVSAENHPDADIAASNIRYSTNGLTCTIRDEKGHTAPFQTKLLGRHNVLNLLLAVAVGHSKGMRLRAMAHAARRLEPVEHRLELKTRNGITIIDDAFNSNPVGAQNAVDLLAEMEGQRRYIVTPGMVEMGPKQDEANYNLGKAIAARNIDGVFLIGDAQTQALQEGLRDHGFPSDKLHIHPTLFDAQDTLTRQLRQGDIVLYENDLPDQYEPVAA